VRPASPQDAAACVAIYRPYVEETAISWEIEVPTVGEMAEMKRLVAETRRLMPDIGIQVPPNLSDWWPELVAAGATDLGGLSANGDHISPEHPFPSPSQVRKRLAQEEKEESARQRALAIQLRNTRCDSGHVLVRRRNLITLPEQCCFDRGQPGRGHKFSDRGDCRL